MSVPVNERKQSKVEFDNTYFKVYEDCVNLTLLNFGAKDEYLIKYDLYIKNLTNEVLNTLHEMGRQIRIANSIYPRNKGELIERRIAQDKAIGLCFDLLTKYQLSMKILRVKDDKYIKQIQNIIHEINCLKSWRSSDNKRFKDIG